VRCNGIRSGIGSIEICADAEQEDGSQYNNDRNDQNHLNQCKTFTRFIKSSHTAHPSREIDNE
jgi:hypothetical protein